MPSMVGYPIEDKRTLRSKKWKEAVATARQKLEIGVAKRRAEREDYWELSEEQYEGNHWEVSDDSDADLIVVNMSFSTVNVIMPYMTGSDPRFLVIPYSGDATPRNAAVQQALLNRQWRSRQVSGKKHATSVAWDYLVYGDGLMKAGYTIKQKRTSDLEYADVAEIWVDRVSPWDFWIDPTADGLHNARWACQRLWITKDELESDPRYQNVDEINVSFTKDNLGYKDSKDTEGQTGFHQEVYDGSEFAVIYEFYDLVKNVMLVFSTGEFPLQVVEDIGGIPIVQLGNYKIPNSPYHMGELEQIRSLQMELNKTRSHLITHRRRNAAKIFAKRGALKQDAMDALQSPIINDVAFVDGDQPLEQLVRAVDLPNLSADVYNVGNLMQEDIYEITGVNEYLRGAGPDIRRTATEASIIEGASNIKSQFKLAQIEEMFKEIGFLILAISRDVFPQTEYDELQLFLTGRDAEQVQRTELDQQGLAAEEAGDMGMMAQIQQMMGQPMDTVVSPSPDIFVGEYEVDVESHSTELRNPVLKEQKAREMAMAIIQMAPLLMQLGVNVNYKRLLEDWFEKAGVQDIEGFLEIAPDQGMGVAPAPAEASQPEPGPGEPPTDLQDPSQMGALTSENTGQFPLG